MPVKDYRGTKAKREIWKVDASLLAGIPGTLKQAAIEVDRWTGKRQLSREGGIGEINRL